MEKLTLKLSHQDLKIMGAVLWKILGGTDVKTLKSELHIDYVLFSAVHPFYNKLEAKCREFSIYGYPPGKMIRVTIKQHEALSFFFLTDEGSPDGCYLPQLQSLELNLIRTIRGEIHKTFLI